MSRDLLKQRKPTDTALFSYSEALLKKSVNENHGVRVLKEITICSSLSSSLLCLPVGTVISVYVDTGNSLSRSCLPIVMGNSSVFVDHPVDNHLCMLIHI